MVGQKNTKNYSTFNFLPENRKFLLNWALWCASRGIDNFLNRRSTCHMSMESYRLAELKYAIFSTTGSKIVDPSRSPCLKIGNRKRFEHRNFLVLRPVLLKNAYFNSADPEPRDPREYGWWSCDKEKLSIPLEAHHKAQSSNIFLSFQAKKSKRAVIFLSFGQSCWTCTFKLPRSRAFEQRMTCPSAAKKICGSHLFWG